MIVIYAAACAAVLAWRLRAALRLLATKRVYEKAENAFRDAERLCKLDEVQLGRPVDYAGQLRLLKAFEARESRKARWTRAVQSAARANQAWSSLRGFHGRRTSYLSGAADVAMAWIAQRQLATLGDWSAQALAWLESARRVW